MSYLRTLAIIFMSASIAFAQEPIVLKHDGWVAAVAFAPDGKTLASAGADNVVRLWEVGTWKPKGVLKGHTDCVSSIAFDDKKNQLVSGSFDGTLKVWNLDKMQMQRSFKRHGGAVLAVATFNGGRLRSGGIGGHVWDFPPDIASKAHRSWVNGLAVHSSSSTILLANGSSDGTVGFRSGRLNAVFLEGGAGEVRCVAFSPDGKLLAAGNRYHTVRVWDVASRKEVVTLKGHMSDVWSIAFSPDGKTLAAADTDWRKPSKVKLWDTTTWKERGGLDVPGEILSIAYSPKGDWLAVGSWDKTVRVFAVR
ncbi:MAG: WD40 repeat domain-containing protein [Planctomycetes bacterium]|nr:WD40 repeat domain-containing protein [Planctomycetota bacterium]